MAKLPPVPHQVAMLDERGYLTPVWADFFKQLFVRVGGNTALTNRELEAIAGGGPGGGGPASAVSVLPSGNISSTDVQAALVELDSEKVPVTRQINGKQLTTNITLTKADIGLSNVLNLDQTDPTNIVQDADHRFVSDSEKATWNSASEFSDDNDYYVDGGIAATFFGDPDGGSASTVYSELPLDGGAA